MVPRSVQGALGEERTQSDQRPPDIPPGVCATHSWKRAGLENGEEPPAHTGRVLSREERQKLIEWEDLVRLWAGEGRWVGPVVKRRGEPSI